MSADREPSVGTFTCPVCGSHFFRTEDHGPEGVRNATGYCKGQHIAGTNYTPCSYSWARRLDSVVFR